MTTAIERVTAPASSPVTLAEAKALARVDTSSEDALIQSLIDAAVDQIDGEGELGRAMITQTWAQWETQSPGWPRLRMGPFQALTSVQYYDADGVLQTATLTDFYTEKDGDFVICRPKDDAEWPTADTRRDAIKITYTAGYGDDPADVPANLRAAILRLVTYWYDNRAAFAEVETKPLPMGFHELISKDRVAWYG